MANAGLTTTMEFYPYCVGDGAGYYTGIATVDEFNELAAEDAGLDWTDPEDQASYEYDYNVAHAVRHVIVHLVPMRGDYDEDLWALELCDSDDPGAFVATVDAADLVALDAQ